MKRDVKTDTIEKLKHIVTPRFILNQTTERNIFKLEYKKGDEVWRNSIWLTFWWFGKNYWLVVFF